MEFMKRIGKFNSLKAKKVLNLYCIVSIITVYIMY